MGTTRGGGQCNKQHDGNDAAAYNEYVPFVGLVGSFTLMLLSVTAGSLSAAERKQCWKAVKLASPSRALPFLFDACRQQCCHPWPINIFADIRRPCCVSCKRALDIANEPLRYGLSRINTSFQKPVGCQAGKAQARG